MLLQPPPIAARVTDDIASGEAVREEAMRVVIAQMASMDEHALTLMTNLAPLVREECGKLCRATIQGGHLEPHDDYWVTAGATNATNRLLEGIGAKHGISNITQDNGHRVLSVKLLLDIEVLPGRNGNDLIDFCGQEYELKTCSLDSKDPAPGTAHHLALMILGKYRKAGFMFAFYHKGALVCLYVLHPNLLNAYFDKWEAEIHAGKTHLNNPKFQINYIRSVGELIYGEPLPDNWKKKYARGSALEAVDDPCKSERDRKGNSLGLALARSLINSAHLAISKAFTAKRTEAEAAAKNARRTEKLKLKELEAAARELRLLELAERRAGRTAQTNQLSLFLSESDVDCRNNIGQPYTIVRPEECEAVL